MIAIRDRFVAVTAVMTSVTLVCAACSSASETGPPHVEGLPAKNASLWALPLDKYLRPLVEPTMQAQQLLVQKCLRADGYAWQVGQPADDAQPGPSWNAVHRKLFSVSLAEKYGYGNSNEIMQTPVDEEVRRSIDAANRATAGKASSKVDQCFSESEPMLDIQGDDTTFALAEELASRAYDEASETASVRASTTRWRDCMRPVGVPDLPSSPEEMPSPSISRLRPTVDYVPPSGDEVVPPEERRVAVADAKCQESSGYARASYEAEWNAQAETLASHADELERYAKQAAKQRSKAEEIIAENAPSK